MSQDRIAHRQRTRAERAAAESFDFAAVLKRVAARRSTSPHALTEPTLPDPARDVPLVTMTLGELHDLVYAASSNYLRDLSGLKQDKARQHATRIGEAAVRDATASDYMHMGRDPRGE